MSRWIVVLALAACSSPPRPKMPPVEPAGDPEGTHRAAVEAQVKPYLDAELVSGIVIGLSDHGKREIYGFGVGPGNKPPDGRTLFQLGPIAKVYTGLLLADAVQRREIELDTPIADLLPPGVSVPTRDKVAITVKHLALHSSGLPGFPPSVAVTSPDPFAKYDEEALYHDLLATQLVATPGTRILYSNYGAGLLGFALGKKLGGYATALDKRILAPLELRDTFVTVPAAAAARRATGTDDDLAPATPWTWNALAGTGSMFSTATDQLHFIEQELDAAAGGKSELRGPMRLTQEAQLDLGASSGGDNEGLGWMIDRAGRYWHGGGGGGFRSFVGFDPRTKRGVVVLAATNLSPLDVLGRVMYDILDGTAKPPPALPDAAALARLAGTYDLGGTRLTVAATGKHLYLEGPGEPRHRIVAFSEEKYWIEALQAVAIFLHDDAGKIARVIFNVNGREMAAPRVE